MRKRKLLSAVPLCGLCCALAMGQSLGNQFTHQGRLLDATGAPVEGVVDLQFDAFNDRLAGDNLGSSGKDGVAVNNGLFATTVEFPAGIFDGSEVWVEVSVNGDILSPRILMTSAPNSLFAKSAAGSSGDFRVSNLGSSGQDGVRVIFGDGPDDLCTIGIDPNLSGLIVNDPGGLRVRNLGSSGKDGVSRILFGPTDDCTIGVDPLLPGLTERDPTGFRLLGQNNEGCRLIFGPTMDCTIEVNPQGPPGLTLRDINCIRLLNPLPNLPTKLLFGPTDDCSLGIDPALPGLTERDPTGFRLLGQNNQGCRLIFGPTMDCTVEVQPQGPPGLLLRDPSGIRILNPDPLLPPVLRFGPTDDCSIGLDPNLPGLVERDPTGFRLLGQNNEGCRLIFGPTMDCTVEVQPNGPPGLLLRDPSGIRLLPPLPDQPPILIFGPTDDCSIGLDPLLPGLTVRDPAGLRVRNIGSSGKDGVSRVVFGPTDDCSIAVDPASPGLRLSDPSGIRIINPDPTGRAVLGFGPTGECRIEASPQEGMIVYEPNGVTILNPLPNQPSVLSFGGAGTCSIQAVPGQGLRVLEEMGVFFEAPGIALNTPPGQPLQFGIELNPALGPRGSGFAAQWIEASSRRFKENIRPINDALTIIDQLQGVRYDWNAAHGGGNDIGFIAEEVGAVLPEIVSWEDDGVNAKGLDYSRLTAIAIEGIKDQQGQIESLRADNAALRAELNELKAQMRAVLNQAQQSK